MVRRRLVALVAAVSAAVLFGCGADGPADPGDATPASLAELARDQTGFDGELVVTEGVVRTYADPPHAWIEDAQQHRVELHPMRLVERHVGDEIRVTGRFTFREGEGRSIEVEQLELLHGSEDRPA